MTQLPRNLAIDALKIAMAMLVVLLHSSGLRSVNATLDQWLNASISHLGVPVFFAISGYYFAGRPVPDWPQIWRQMRRLFGMYLFWTTVFLPMIVATALHEQRPFLRIAQFAVTGYFHLWYLLHMPLVLVCGWALQRRGLSQRNLLTLGGLLYSAGCFIQYAGMYGWPEHSLLNKTSLTRNFIFLGLPFFMLGIVAQQRRPIENRVHLLSLLLGGVLLLMLETWVNAQLGGTRDSHLNLVLALPIATYALLRLAATSSWLSTSRNMADTSVAIFLLHPLFLFFLQRWTANSLTQWLLSAALAAGCVPLLRRLSRHSPFVW